MMAFHARDEGESVLQIDGEITTGESWWEEGGRITARNFRRSLETCGDVVVYINSPGGDVFAGAEIYTALKEHRGRVTVKISGIAASAASVIAMAGDEVLMSPVSYMMIHDPWTYAVGNAREMAHQADVLREIGEGLIAAYTAKTGLPRDQIQAMLADETYMNAEKAVELGFADGILYETEETPRSNGSKAALMRARRYGPSAVCAMVRAADDRPDSRRRAEIALRAKIIADYYIEQGEMNHD